MFVRVLADDDAWAAKVKELSLVVHPPINTNTIVNTEEYAETTKFAWPQERSLVGIDASNAYTYSYL